jgi:N-acetylneuraminic acid mutarotase
MAYDPVKDRVYEVGGYYGYGFDAVINDLWSFAPRTRTWTQIADVLPPGNGDALALDVQSRRIIEYQPFAEQIETWAYDLETGKWENRHPAVEPPARWGSMMVYDPAADRILLYGGTDLNDGSTVLGDLWAYDYESNSWTALHPRVSPAPHHFPVLEYVPTIDRVVLFGGFQQGFASLFNDTWAYDYRRNRWVNLRPKNPPAPRAYHYMAFDPASNQIVLFGGILHPSDQPDETTINETWTYSVSRNAWMQVFPDGAPGPRAWHAMSHTGGPVVLFGGGASRFSYTNETFLYKAGARRWELVAGGAKAGGSNTLTDGGAVGPVAARLSSRRAGSGQMR